MHDHYTKNRIALSVDIEDWYHNPAIIGSEFSKYKTIDDFIENYPCNYEGFKKPFNRLLCLLKEAGETATFFVVGDLAKRFPYIIDSIMKDGHEIACHGLYHYTKVDLQRMIMRYSPSKFEDMTAESKYVLEKLSGKKVYGYRAPSAYICGEMIDSLEKIGFRYDSSVAVNSIYKKSFGSTHGAATSPYYPARGALSVGSETRKIVEFPWPYYKILGIKFPTGGGPFLRFFGKNYIAKGLRQSLLRGDTVLYFHSIDISNEKIPSLGSKRPFYFAVRGDVVEKRIIALLSMFKDRFSRFIDILPKYVGDITSS